MTNSNNSYAKFPDGSMVFFNDRSDIALSGKLMSRASRFASWEVVLWRRPERQGLWQRFRQVGEERDLYMLVQLVNLDSADVEDVVRAMKAIDGYRIHGLNSYALLIKHLREKYRPALEQAGVLRPKAAA
jgi:hypothetical protein